MKYLVSLSFFLLFFSGCASKYDTNTQALKKNSQNRQTIVDLSSAISELKTTVDKNEAKKVAVIATLYPLELANEYQLVKPPLFHNTLINMNIKKRGFCYHFAEDTLKELKKLKLKTLDIRWAIHKKQDYWEHNALVITAKKQSFKEGIILDAWRNSGKLYWDYLKNDTQYNWSEDIQKNRYYGLKRRTIE